MSATGEETTPVTAVALEDYLQKNDEDDSSSMDDYIKSMVFGGLDGIITTFAVVAAGAGANLEGRVVVLMGFANLVSDGISMGLGDYFSEKSENQYIRMEKKRESWEMENNPEGEIKEMIEIFTDDKKMKEEDATEIITIYAKYEDHFVDFMMVNELELGVPGDDDDGLWKQGFITMLSFWFFGAIPVAAFAIADAYGAPTELRLIVDCIVTLLTLGLLGACKAHVNGTPIISSSLLMVFNGGLACTASYMIAWGLAEAMGGTDVLCLGATCDAPAVDSYRFNNAPWVGYESGLAKPSSDDQFWDCSARSGVDESDSDSNVFYSRVNLFSGEVGNYEFVGFDGQSPELTVKIGETYLFDQTHHTNWYHPLGFSYYPDGAHGLSWGSEEREEVESPNLKYRINKMQPDGNLDEYEPEFLYPRGEWLQRKYTVELKITDEIARTAAKHGGVLYYFCHIHNKMSGKIRITGSYQKDGTPYQTNYEESAYAPRGAELNEYTPHQADAFDTTCGTYEASPYQNGSAVCAGMQFLCNHAEGTFAQCMHAIDCKMQVEMTIRGHDVHNDPIAIFMQQMIPHHTNAVNMARVMLKTQDIRSDSFANNLMYEIINNQNMQIHQMRNYLSDRRHALPPGAACANLTHVYALANLKMEHGTRLGYGRRV